MLRSSQIRQNPTSISLLCCHVQYSPIRGDHLKHVPLRHLILWTPGRKTHWLLAGIREYNPYRIHVIYFLTHHQPPVRKVMCFDANGCLRRINLLVSRPSAGKNMSSYDSYAVLLAHTEGFGFRAHEHQGPCRILAEPSPAHQAVPRHNRAKLYRGSSSLNDTV